MTDFLREPALFVGDIEDDINLSLPPASGEEYIKRVVKEAQQYKDVVVAEIDRTRLKNQMVTVKHLGGCIEAPVSLCPSLEWQQCQIADFSSLRLYITRLKNDVTNAKRRRQPLTVTLPSIDDQSGWISFCSDSTSKDPFAPTLTIILSMNQPLVEQVLEYLVEFIETLGTFGEILGQWIYALLVILELPLNPETCSCLRSLARACSVIRAKLSTTDTKLVAAVNLFICLVARYFRQMDLADP